MSLNPEIGMFVVKWITRKGKADAASASGRQQSEIRKGEYRRHHRGLRAGHVFRGVTWEPGRACDLLVQMPGKATGEKEPGSVGMGFLPTESPQGTRTSGSRQGIGRRATNEACKDGSQEVGVLHSTERT